MRGIDVVACQTRAAGLALVELSNLGQKYSLPEDLMLDPSALTCKAGILRTSMTHDGSSIIHGHSYRELSRSKREYRRKSVILLGRNVADLVVSGYFQATTRVKRFEGSMSEYIRDDRYGARKIVRFYKCWLENRHVPRRFLLIRYEDMRRDAATTLGQVSAFLGAERVEEEIVKGAVEFASFERLREMEKSGKFDETSLRQGQKGNEESFKVRRGVVGGYRDYLSQEDIDYLAVVQELGWPPELIARP